MMITKHKMKEMFQLPKIILAVIACSALVGCSTRSGPPADVQYDTGASPYHTVKKGDSIASIARKYGMDKRELVRINSLASPYRIVKGQRLLVRAHRSDGEGAADEMEMPATEQVESVPEEEDIDVKPLSPIAGATGVAAAGAAAVGVAQSPFTKPEVDDETEYGNPPPAPQQSLPASAGSFIWPTQGNVIRDFSSPGKGRAQNDGINIAAPRGTPVVAANNGIVAHAGNQLRGFGNVVLVKHDNGMMTVYAHLDKVSVRKGVVVRAGQKLGTVGQTGTVKSPQLHFEIRKGRKPIDPSQYLG
jgi:lipoprotein NlpD